MAGTIDQTEGEAKPFLLMLRATQAARADAARPTVASLAIPH